MQTAPGYHALCCSRTPGGRASAVVYLTSRPATPRPFLAQLTAAAELVTDQLCAARARS